MKRGIGGKRRVYIFCALVLIFVLVVGVVIFVFNLSRTHKEDLIDNDVKTKETELFSLAPEEPSEYSQFSIQLQYNRGSGQPFFSQEVDSSSDSPILVFTPNHRIDAFPNREKLISAGIDVDDFLKDLDYYFEIPGYEVNLIEEPDSLDFTVKRNYDQRQIGWIVELTEMSLAEKFKEQGVSFSGGTTEEKRGILSQHRNNLKNQQDGFESQFRRITRQGEIKSKTSLLSNYVFLDGDVSQGEIDRIERLSMVERVYPEFELSLLLMDSIPLIGADDVWQIGVDGGSCISVQELVGSGLGQGNAENVNACNSVVEQIIDLKKTEELPSTRELNELYDNLETCSADPFIAQKILGGYAQEIGSDLCGEATADINGDGIVSTLDLVQVILAWHDYYSNPDADVNGDGEVDTEDLIEVILAWGPVGECICIRGQGVTIGIIDTGVDYNHPDLGGCFGEGCKVVGGWDFVNGDGDPMDDQGHGTHVSATAAGNGDWNGDGVVEENEGLNGVAPDASIVAYKVLNSAGSGSPAAVIAAIERSIDPNQDCDDFSEPIDECFSDHLDVISLSLGANCLGGYDENCGPDDPLSSEIDTAVDVGVIAVISAGNSGPDAGTIGTPGVARKAITVGATHKVEADQVSFLTCTDNDVELDRIACFSSRGPVVLESGEIVNKPDIVAPGVNVCAAQWDDAWSSNECHNGDHTAISGTSMAAPHVSGLAALLRQKYNDTPPGLVKETIKLTADNVIFVNQGLSDPINALGGGRINALNAILLEPDSPYFVINNFIFEESPQSSNNDGVIDSGEAVDLTIDLENVWGDAEDVSVTLTTIEPGIEILDGEQIIGDVFSGEEVSMTLGFQIDETILPPNNIYFSLNIGMSGWQDQTETILFFFICPGGACEVCGVDDVARIGNFLEGDYLQVCDIDFEGEFFSSIQGKFTGNYDGNGYKMLNFVGESLFDEVGGGGYVNRVVMRNVSLGDYGGERIGGISKYVDESSVINNTHISGNIDGNTYVGGIVGGNFEGMIVNSSFNGTITCTDLCGGIAGVNFGTIIKSSARGSISAVNYSGGVVGMNSGVLWAVGLVSNSLAENNVEGEIGIGGLIGISLPYLGLAWDVGNKVSGSVHGQKDIGGLIGLSDNNFGATASLFSTFVGDEVVGNENVGGVIGSLIGASVIGNVSLLSNVNGGDNVGGIVGSLSTAGLFNSSALVVSTRVLDGSNVSGDTAVGGIVGLMHQGSSSLPIVNKSFSHARVEGLKSVGGLVGQMRNMSFVERSYSVGEVSGGDSVGGFVGKMEEQSKIHNSFAQGSVEATIQKAGGFAGHLKDGPIVERTYSSGIVTGGARIRGGFVGDMDEGSTVSFSNWDVETTGIGHGCGEGDCDGIEGHNTAVMKMQSTYDNWNFNTIWDIVEDVTYPFLRPDYYADF